MTYLRIHCLGRLRITLDGDVLTGFHSSKAQALLCYLAVTGVTHTRSALAGLLWGDLPESSARANLRKVLSNLRQLVGPHLAISHAEIGINHAASWWLDVAELEASLRDSTQVTPENIAAVEEAIARYAGDFLYGFDVTGAPDFEVWSLSQRARLHELATHALDGLVSYYADTHETAVAIQYAKRLIAMEPWREESHRSLMRLLAQSGERSAALMQYETCRQVLEAELGVEPSQETAALYAAIRRDELAPIVASDTSTPRSSPPVVQEPAHNLSHTNLPPHNLPPQATPFIGRQAELAALHNLLAQPDMRLVTVLGVGGMGKTRLALAALDSFVTAAPAAAFRDGFYFVALAALPDPAALVPTVAQALNFSFYAGDAPQAQLVNYLRHKQLLLLLDNFEYLLPDVTFISELLQQAPGVKLLVTSRLKLNLQGEHLFPVTGLDFPTSDADDGALALGAVQAYDAVQLFTQVALRVRPGYAWTAEDWPAILRICRLTAGMPLALMLAATWMEMLSPQEIVHEIDHEIDSQTDVNLDFLAADLLDLPDRHRSMRAVFDSAWDLLRAEEQTLYAAFSIFRGGFTRQAAQAVTDASLRDLMTLANRSFLQRMPDGRFAMHELLRQYAAGRLAHTLLDQDALRDRHSAYFCADLQAHEAEWKQGREVAAFAAIAADFENMRAAWRWAANRGQVAWLAQAMDSLGEFYSWEARYQEGEAAFAYITDSLAAQRAEAAKSPPLALLVEVKALVWQAEFDREFLGQRKRAMDLLAKAEALLQDPALLGHDIRRERAFLLVQLARVARDQGDQARDLAQWQESLRLSQELDDREWIAYKTEGLGWMALRAGNDHEAYHRFDEARALWQEQGNTLYLTNNLAGMGMVALNRGDLAESETMLRERLAISRTRGKLEKLVNPYEQLGATLLYSGKFLEAKALLQEGIEVYAAAGRVEVAARLRQPQAMVMAHLGHYAEAYLQANSVYVQQQALPKTPGLAEAAFAVGHIDLAKGEHAQAAEWLKRSVDLFEQFGRLESQGLSLALLAVAQQALGHSAQAMRSLTTAQHLLVSRNAFPSLIYLFPVVACVFARQGRAQQAAEYYALALHYAFVARSRWFADVVGEPVTAAAASLSQEARAAVQSRVQAQDLWTAAQNLSLDQDIR